MDSRTADRMGVGKLLELSALCLLVFCGAVRAEEALGPAAGEESGPNNAETAWGEYPRKYCRTEGEPIFVGDGNVEVYEVDLRIECPLIDLEFHRSYNSQIEVQSPLGDRWTHSYDWRLSKVSISNELDIPPWNGRACVEPQPIEYYMLQALADPNLGPYRGNIRWFREVEPGEYVSCWDDRPFRLTQPDAETLEVMIPGGRVYAFSTNGLLQKISHPAGQSVRLSYGGTAAHPLLARAEHSNGQYLEFSYDEWGRLSEVSTPSEELSVTFSYGGSGSDTLQSVTRHTAGGDYTCSYEYDYWVRMQGSDKGYEEPWEFLTRRVDANGCAYEYEYADLRGHLKEYGPEGVRGSRMHAGAQKYYQVKLDYRDTNHVEVTRRRGDDDQVLEYWTDPMIKKTIKVVGPGNEDWVERLEYNGTMDLVSHRFEDLSCGESVRVDRAYDASHNVTNEAVGYGGAATAKWRWEWDTNRWVVTAVTDPSNRRVEFEYRDALLTGIRLVASPTVTYDTQLAYSPTGLLAAVTNANGHWVRIGYDSSGYATNVTPQAGPSVGLGRDELGHVNAILLPGADGPRSVQIETDDRGRATNVVYPNNQTQSFRYDPYGHLLRAVDTAGRTNRFTYLPGGRLASVTRVLEGDPDREVTIGLDYDQQLNMLRVSDPLGREVEVYELDLADRVVSVSNLESQVLSVSRGVSEFVNAITRFDGTTVRFGYDAGGRVSEVEYPSVSDEYEWLANGLLASAANEAGTVSNGYDSVNRLTVSRGTGPSGTVEYAYYAGGEVSGVTSVAGSMGYTNDAAERLSGLGSAEGGFGYGYDAYNGLAATVTNPQSGVNGVFSYDVVDRLTNLVWRDGSGTALQSFGYGYDAAGMITNVVYADGSRSEYAYDSLYRLTGEKRYDAGNGLVYDRAWEYDLAGNRTNVVDGGTNTAYTLGAGNRLSSWGAGTGMSYAEAGNVTRIDSSASSYLTLSWNERYQVGSVSTNGTLAEAYGYDALGRRAWVSDGSTTNFLVYDGIHVIAEVDTSGNLLKSYTHGPGLGRSAMHNLRRSRDLPSVSDALRRRGPRRNRRLDPWRQMQPKRTGIDDILAMTVYGASETNTYYFIKDHQNTVHAVVDESGEIVESYRYDAWGRVLGVYDGDGVPLAESAIGNHYLFQGRWYSWKTGFYYFRARWYDPVTGRWLSKDPIGISGGLNQYVFCNNNPVMYIDPTGLWTFGWKGMVSLGGFGVAGVSAVVGWVPGVVGGAVVGVGFLAWDMLDDWGEDGTVDRADDMWQDVIDSGEDTLTPGDLIRDSDGDGVYDWEEDQNPYRGPCD